MATHMTTTTTQQPQQTTTGATVTNGLHIRRSPPPWHSTASTDHNELDIDYAYDNHSTATTDDNGASRCKCVSSSGMYVCISFFLLFSLMTFFTNRLVHIQPPRPRPYTIALNGHKTKRPSRWRFSFEFLFYFSVLFSILMIFY